MSPSSSASPTAGPSSPRQQTGQQQQPPPQEQAQQEEALPTETLSAPQSLRDLLAASEQGGTRRRPSAGPARQGTSPSNGAPPRQEVPGANGHSRRSSAVITVPEPHRSESRWNGWHMWRQESDDAKRLRAQARELRQAPSTSSEDARARRPRTQHSQAGVAYKMKRWSRRFYGSIRGMWGGSGNDDDDQEEEERRRRSAAAGGLFEDREEIVASSFDPEAPLSKIRLIALSISLAGAQVAWTLELAYGTPYLLGLGLSPEAVSLVWLAGPASGLIMQPLIGALSDADVQSRFRRRKYMIYSAAIIFLSTLVLAFALPLSTLVVDLLNIGLGDWDPKRNAAAHRGTQIVSVLSFWILDFALNGLQASSRALILDVAPTSQQTTANAYQGMMSNVGNVVGYLVGWINLSSWGILRWLGGGQFRRFAVFAVVIMVLCVAITVVSTQERPDFNASREGGSHQQQQMLQERAVLEQAKMTSGKRLRKILRDLWHAIRRLPRPIRRVCVTQTFNFAAWFCFLFYASQYYMEVKRLDAHHNSGDSDELVLRLSQKQQEQPSSDVDFEQGSFAMLMYAVVALASGFILPFFALGSDVRARAPQLPSSQSAHAHSVSAGSSLPGARAVQRRLHAIYRGLRYGITLRTLWSCGALLYAAIMAATFFVQTPVQAVILIASIGIPWSITAWAPFAMIGEFVREANAGSSPYEFEDDHHGPRRSAERRRRRSQVAVSSSSDAPGFPFHAASDSGETPSSVSAGSDSRGGAPRRPILASSGGSSTAQLPGSLDTEDEAAMAGTVLGIHNLAIVIPQLLMSFIASVIFDITDNKKRHGDDAPDYDQQALQQQLAAVVENGPQVAWVLRFGGLMAIIACVLARSVPLTRTERRRRGELVDLHLDEDEETERREGEAGPVSL